MSKCKQSVAQVQRDLESLAVQHDGPGKYLAPHVRLCLKRKFDGTNSRSIRTAGSNVGCSIIERNASHADKGV